MEQGGIARRTSARLCGARLRMHSSAHGRDGERRGVHLQVEEEKKGVQCAQEVFDDMSH